MGLFAIIGGLGLNAGWVTPEALIAGMLLGPAVSAPVAVGGPRVQAIQTGMMALGSIAEFLALPRLSWGNATAEPGALPRVEHASLRYGDAPALDDVSLRLPGKGLVALVGASGSGKSTLAMLLARFADPASGRITLGQADYPQLSEQTLYRHVGFVFQDTHLPDAPIREILSGGRPVSDARLREAARMAAIDAVIEALPESYDTILGEDAELSGGQRQRLALARALLGAPDLLVLDEALSALDETTAGTVLRSLRQQAEQRTVLLISHQLRLTRDADRILVLDSGRLVGDGHHEQLMRQCQTYRELWQAQPAAHIEEGTH
jgi:ATP-binding cassette subfamily B protein